MSVVHSSNVTGTVAPLEEIIEIAHDRGALVMSDDAQYAPHHPLNMKKSDVDFSAISVHKMCGPTGMGSKAKAWRDGEREATARGCRAVPRAAQRRISASGAVDPQPLIQGCQVGPGGVLQPSGPGSRETTPGRPGPLPAGFRSG